jgi:hypothetical protein
MQIGEHLQDPTDQMLKRPVFRPKVHGQSIVTGLLWNHVDPHLFRSPGPGVQAGCDGRDQGFRKPPMWLHPATGHLGRHELGMMRIEVSLNPMLRLLMLAGEMRPSNTIQQRSDMFLGLTLAGILGSRRGRFAVNCKLRGLIHRDPLIAS